MQVRRSRKILAGLCAGVLVSGSVNVATAQQTVPTKPAAIAEPYATGPGPAPFIIDGDTAIIFGTRVPLPVAVGGAILALLGLAGAAAGIAMAMKGDGNGSSGNGSSNGETPNRGREKLGENTWRADNGVVYETNPQARVGNQEQVDLLLPGGENDVESTRSLDTAALAAAGVKQGDVLSFLPNNTTPDGALIVVESVTDNADGTSTVVTRQAYLDDIVLHTEGKVEFYGQVPAEGTQFVPNAEYSDTFTLKVPIPLGKKAEESTTATTTTSAKPSKTPTKPGYVGADVSASLEGSIEYGFKVAYNRPNWRSFGVASWEATQKNSLTATVEAEGKATYDFAKALNKAEQGLDMEKKFFPMVGPIPLVVELELKPDFDLEGEFSAEGILEAKTESSSKFGIEVNGDTGDFTRIQESNKETGINPSTGVKSKIEFTLGGALNVTAYELIGAGTGLGYKRGLELGYGTDGAKCKRYASIVGPKGVVFAQFFSDATRIETEVSVEAKFEDTPFACDWIGSKATTSKPSTTKPAPKPTTTKPAPKPQTATGEVPYDVRKRMLNMTIPPVCGFRGGTLVNGELPKTSIPTGRMNGFLRITTDMGKKDPVDQIRALQYDTNGDGKMEIVAIMQGYGGGVAWPPSLFVFDQNLKLVNKGSYNCGLDFPQEAKQARSGLDEFYTDGKNLHLKWYSYGPEDYMCCPSRIASGWLRISGDQLVPVGRLHIVPRS